MEDDDPTDPRIPIDFRKRNVRQGRPAIFDYVEDLNGVDFLGYVDGFDSRKGAVIVNAEARLEAITRRCPGIFEAVGRDILYGELLRQEACMAELAHSNRTYSLDSLAVGAH